MKNAAMVFAGGTRVAGRSDSVTQHREDWRVARAVHSDLLLLGMPRVNLLLTGRYAVIRNVLDTLTAELDDPIMRWCPGKRLLLPAAARVGTVILEDVGALTLDEQRRLLAWMDQSVGRTQIVSTTSAPLFPWVEAGDFLHTLYYRLNTLYVDVTT